MYKLTSLECIFLTSTFSTNNSEILSLKLSILKSELHSEYSSPTVDVIYTLS